MIKRILLVLAIVAMAGGQCFARGDLAQTASRWKTYTVKNSSGTYLLTEIPATSIVPQVNVILGYNISKANLATGSELVVTLYDGGVSSTDEVIDEAERETGNYTPCWFPRARTLEKQLFIHQGPNTVVTIYFE